MNDWIEPTPYPGWLAWLSESVITPAGVIVSLTCSGATWLRENYLWHLFGRHVERARTSDK